MGWVVIVDGGCWWYPRFEFASSQMLQMAIDSIQTTARLQSMHGHMTGTRNAITRTNTTINGESVGIVHVALSPILRCTLVSLPDHEMPLHEQSRSSRRGGVTLNACFTG
jgi:hypothetical protein